MSININQNWNDMSSSSSQEEARKEEEEEVIVVKARQQSAKAVSQKNEGIEGRTKTEGEEGRPPRQYNERKRAYLTDEQLLSRYESKTVDDPKAIKVSKCLNEDQREIIKSLKTARVKELNQSTFLIFFYSEEDLIQFFKQKIDKRYKFYFNMFQKRERKEDDPRNRKERKGSYNYRRPERENTRGSQGDQKEKEYQKDQIIERDDKEEKPQRRKKRYYSYDSGEEENKTQITKKVEPEIARSQDKPKEKNIEKPIEQPIEKPKEKPEVKIETKDEEPKPEEEAKKRRNTQHKLLFQIADNSNVITIHQDSFDPHKVLEAISRKKLMKQFSKIHIKAPFYTFPKVSILLLEIAKFNFFLEKEPPTESEDDKEFELVLIQKGQNKTDSFYDRYHKMTLEKEVHVRMLGDKFDDYFMDIDKHNLSEITNGFDADEYIKRLKESGPIIQKHWNTWRIEAQEDQIQALLKLINRIKKSTVYDIGLKPSLRNEKALLTAELKERPESERRPKVDASHANNYLN